jgi:hypothetical protein
MNADHQVTATFTETLTVSRGGDGSGSVTSNPAGISCGGACSHSYTHGTKVTLTATAATGSHFSGWSGPCTGTGSCTVTMNHAYLATASFNLPKSLTVIRSGNGSGSVASNPAAISCGSTCSHSFIYGTKVILTATPAADSRFGGWTGACTGTGSCTVNMTQVRSVTATFIPVRVLTVSRTGNGSGTVTSHPAGISCGSTCSHSFDYGTKVILTATHATGTGFTGWKGACTGTGKCTVTMKQARSVTATFTLVHEMLRVKKSGSGLGRVASKPAGISCGGRCSHGFDYGTKVTLTATAAKGSLFSGWTGACTGTGTCTVTMTKALSVRATFTRKP